MPKTSTGLPVHYVVVSCPHDDCDGLQNVPLSRNGAQYSVRVNHQCTLCGKLIFVAGGFTVCEGKAIDDPANTAGLPVHHITVSCPNGDCDGLQKAPVSHIGARYLARLNHWCTICGEIISIGGEVNAYESETFRNVIASK